MSNDSGKNRIKGKAKEAVGNATGDERLASEGRTDQAKGKAKRAMGSAKERAKGAKDSLKDRDDS